MEKDKSIEELNKLIEINNDRIEGYETASKESDETDLKNLFAQFITTSVKCKQELVNEVIKLGGTPIEGTRITGKFFRVWMDVKAALTNKDRKAIMRSCEYGEEVAIETYEDVLEERENIFPDLYMLVKTQLMLIKHDYSKIKSFLEI